MSTFLPLRVRVLPLAEWPGVSPPNPAGVKFLTTIFGCSRPPEPGEEATWSAEMDEMGRPYMAEEQARALPGALLGLYGGKYEVGAGYPLPYILIYGTDVAPLQDGGPLAEARAVLQRIGPVYLVDPAAFADNALLIRVSAQVWPWVKGLLSPRAYVVRYRGSRVFECAPGFEIPIAGRALSAPLELDIAEPDEQSQKQILRSITGSDVH